MNSNSLRKALNIYLSKEIEIFKNLNSTDKFLKFYEIKMTKYKFSKDELLKIFYFNRFFSIIFQNDTKSIPSNEIPLNENKLFISNIEDIYINNIFDKLKMKELGEVYKDLDFFLHFGSYRKSIVYKLFDKYIENFNNINDFRGHLLMLKIFLIQDINNGWENKVLEIIKIIDKKPFLDKTEFFLLYHFSEKFKNDKLINFNFHMGRNPVTEKDDKNITKTQSNIKKLFEVMKIEYIEEYQADGYSYDYYLPKLNIVLEFDGPLHFFPLQAQFIDNYKFRYRMINDLFQKRVVYIPYYEWMKMETDSFTLEYLKKIIYNKWDYKDTNCFRESYDISNIGRKFL